MIARAPQFLTVMLLGALGMSAAAAEQGMQKRLFGHAGSQQVDLYTLSNAHGIELQVMTYGATIVSLKTPDRAGRLQNIVLGFDSLEPYLAGVPYFGATVGRYANRIAQGRFELEGKRYELPRNDGPNTLHGGLRGFDKRIWTAEPLPVPKGVALRLTYVSVAGEQGYPGTLTAHVTYRLGDDDALTIEYQARTSAATPVNLANHAYFNLSGDPRGTILQHVLEISASRFTPVDAHLIPTGELKSVAGTPFDFREPQSIGSRISADDEQLRLGHGYDHNWVLDRKRSGELAPAAVLSDPASGRVLEIRTTQPGVQFYSGNFLDGKPAGSGSAFAYRSGLCLETQHFPDSPNEPSFPSTILQPGQTYRETTVLSFRAK
ncbi:MAG TPA: aldose epimerase family protein [Steroidobacteraceae bacterium]|nr:aldose epimerase family protein [Steroidobacteraceae bacterium]